MDGKKLHVAITQIVYRLQHKIFELVPMGLQFETSVHEHKHNA